MNDTTQPNTTASRRAKIEGQLQDTKPSMLEDGDYKIAKKRAKKHGTETDEEVHARLLEKNLPQAQALWLEFGRKIVDLGYTMQPVMRISQTGIAPTVEFRPLGAAEQVEAQKNLAK